MRRAWGASFAEAAFQAVIRSRDWEMLPILAEKTDPISSDTGQTENAREMVFSTYRSSTGSQILRSGLLKRDEVHPKWPIFGVVPQVTDR